MLSNEDVIATIAVRSIHAADEFYEGMLGLTREPDEEPGVRSYKCGTSTLFVYESQYAGTNKATAATWLVDDIEGVVKTLRAKGVAFEHYDLPNTTRKGDLHVSGKTKAAWFKDRDGNILALVNR